MDKNAVYQKTRKGVEEMTSRAHHLPARERSVLILVDGKGTAREIIDKARHFGDAERFFEALIADGFIEQASAAAAAPAAAPQASAPQAPPAPPAAAPVVEKSLAEAKDFAAFFLVKVAGPQADTMTGAIEACKDREQLMSLLVKYREVVRAAGGSRKAEEFWNGATARLP